MYLRHTTRRKDGKTHVNWQLVRSVRHGGKVVQETVAQLGELDSEGCARAKALAQSISGRGAEFCQGRLFDDGEPVKALAVKLDGIRLERSRSFGAVWLGWLLWRALRLDELLSELLPLGRERVRWGEVIAILVIGRLCEPSSELHVAERWYRSTALEDLLGVSPEHITTSVCIVRWTGCWRTKKRWSAIGSNAWENSLSWTTICCSTISRAPTSKG